MRLNEQEIAERKRNILHTAYQLFCEFGVDGVTLAQIAKEADVGASTIYRYFETKANLLWHTQKILWREIVDQIHADGKEQLLSAANGFEELAILLYRFKAIYTQHSGYLLFASDYKMYLVRNGIKLSAQAYDQLLQPVCEVLQAALQRGHKDGSIHCENSVDDQFFAIWGTMRSFTEQIVIYDKMYGGENPWGKRFDLVYHYMLKALKKEESNVLF